MMGWGMEKRSAAASVLCGLGLLAACNDASDRPDAAAAAGAAAEAAEALTFQVEGTLCGEQVSYEASAPMTLVLTPSGLVQALVIGDGPLTRIDDVEAMKAYGESYDVIANLSLEEPAPLGTGSLGWASGALRARAFGSLKLSGDDQRPLEISEYEPGKRIAGSITHQVGWFSDSYPDRGDASCGEGELTFSFEGGFDTWDGQADCYSPSQNLDRIENGFALGCKCDPNRDEAACVSICSDPSEVSGQGAACDGMAVALFCTGEQWQWGHDGPCH